MSGPPIKKEAPGRQAQASIKPNDSTQRIQYWSEKGKLVHFGPFLVEPGLIRLTGRICGDCGTPVRRLDASVAGIVPRLVLNSCDCVTVAAWEDKDHRPLFAKVWPTKGILS